MLSILMNFVFTIISKIADIILLPIIVFLSALIPSFTSFYSSILAFIDYSFTFLLFFVKLLCIPQPCMLAVITVATATLSITIGLRTYKLIMIVYQKFKP